MFVVLLGFGLIPSALGYIVYFGGLNRVKETSKVPVLASVETVMDALIGLAVFGQPLTIVRILGILLVLCSILVMNLKRTQRPQQASKS